MRRLAALLLLAACSETLAPGTLVPAAGDPGDDTCRVISRVPLAADERGPDGRTTAEIAELLAGDHAGVISYLGGTPTGAHLELSALGTPARLRFQPEGCDVQDVVYTPASVRFRTEDGSFDEVVEVEVQSRLDVVELRGELDPLRLRGSWKRARPVDPSVLDLSAQLGAGTVEGGSLDLRSACDREDCGSWRVGTLGPDWPDCSIEPALRAFAGPGATNCGIVLQEPFKAPDDRYLQAIDALLACYAESLASRRPFFGYVHGRGYDSRFAYGDASDGSSAASFRYDSCPSGCGSGDPHLYRTECAAPASVEELMQCASGERMQICP